MSKLTGRIAVFALALVVWLLLTWQLNAQTVAIGALASLIAALAFGGLLSVTSLKMLNPVRYFWLLVYLPIFVWEMIKANFDVAYRVLHPKLPINPGIVRIKTRLKGEVARTVLANSITLTPGTMTVDIMGDELYIHWIEMKTKDVEAATRIIASRFENLIARIFE